MYSLDLCQKKSWELYNIYTILQIVCKRLTRAFGELEDDHEAVLKIQKKIHKNLVIQHKKLVMVNTNVVFSTQTKKEVKKKKN